MKPLPFALLAFCLFGCRGKAQEARLPTPNEVSESSVIVSYGPTVLRLFPTPPGYLILASERPELTAVFRALGVTAQKPPPGFLARAGQMAWIGDHVVFAPPVDKDSALAPRLVVYDRDAKVGTKVDVALPAPCSPSRAPLLQSDGKTLYALLNCQEAKATRLLKLDEKAQLLSSRTLTGANEGEGFIHEPDADYILAGRQVLRFSGDEAALPKIGAVPRSFGTSEVRDLVRIGELLFVVDGAAGQVTALDAANMGWRFEKRFPVSAKVKSLRATAGGKDRLYIVTAEETRRGPELFGTMISFGEDRPPPRLILGPLLETANHEALPPELVPAFGGGALLFYTQRGNSGPLVALRKLNL